jgi:aminoglycoside phosphotransferase (APT) family kinase protein
MVAEELLRVVRAALDQGAFYVAEPQPIAGGFWATIHGFQLDCAENRWGQPLVLRVMPDPGVATKEIIVQTILADHGFATPHVLLSGFDEALGGAFMIMERVPGRSPLAGLDLHGRLRDVPRTLRRLPVMLAAVALQLHSQDPAPVLAALHAGGVTLPEVGSGGHHANIAAAALIPDAGFDRIASWLSARVPATVQPVVCHGDLHPFNILVGDDGVVTVLDWTNANISPRELDIGSTSALLRCAPISVPAPARPLLRMVTRRLANRFVAEYRAGAAVDPATLRWFEALQYSRCLAEVALSRSSPGGRLSADHPFESAADQMVRALARVTGITVALGDVNGRASAVD